MRTADNLCLHYVSEGAPSRRFTLSKARVRELIEARLSEGLRAASLAEYADAPVAEDRFTLSFDDAHRSLLDHALPLLQDLDVTATVFVPTAYIETSPEFLTWDGLRQLRDAGWTIGSHTASHRRLGWRLYEEDANQHAARLRDDLARSRDAIQRELGIDATLFAYPYGEAGPDARAAVKAAGFAAAFTAGTSRQWNEDVFAIPRVDAMELDLADGRAERPAPLFLSVIVPACDRAGILADVVTRLASQTYPEDRYEVIVVDDGSVGDLSPIFDEMPPNVRFIRQGDDRFRAGQARQRGADESHGSHLVFLDADVAVEEDYLWHVDWVHGRSENVVLLGYLSGYNLHDLGFLHTPDNVIGRSLDTLAVIEDRSREPTLRSCLDNLDWLDEPWPLTYTGNLSLPRALLDQIGGFDSAFVGWGLEDVDLGIRLHEAGAQFLFSRFALGRHIVDPNEGESRNPFRAGRPTLERFAGYLKNLDHLEARHAGLPAVARYVARARADIDETCAEPMTVGIEFGGAASRKSLHHRALHQVQPGGFDHYELLDRVAYASKIGATTIFLLGGAPAEHPAFLDVLRAAAAAVSWVSMQTMVYPFAEVDLLPRATELGLRGAVFVAHTLRRDAYETIYGRGTYDTFEAGLKRLQQSGIELSARVIRDPDHPAMFDETERDLAARGIGIDEITDLT